MFVKPKVKLRMRRKSWREHKDMYGRRKSIRGVRNNK